MFDTFASILNGNTPNIETFGHANIALEFNLYRKMAKNQAFNALVEPDITTQNIIGGKNVISTAERLILTLRFLATAEIFQSSGFQFRISDRTHSDIVKEVCNAILKYLVPLYLKSH